MGAHDCIMRHTRFMKVVILIRGNSPVRHRSGDDDQPDQWLPLAVKFDATHSYIQSDRSANFAYLFRILAAG